MLLLWIAGGATVVHAAVPLGTCDAAVENREALERGEILVELRDVENSAAKLGCAVAVIEAAPEEVFAVVRDADRYDEFMPRVKASTVRIDDLGRRLNTQDLTLPFPLRDRHYTVVLQESSGPPQWVVQWDYLHGSGNVDESIGAWTVEEWGTGRSLLRYEIFSDPGGMLPMWAVNRTARSTLPKIMEATRARLLALRREGAKERARTAAATAANP